MEDRWKMPGNSSLKKWQNESLNERTKKGMRQGKERKLAKRHKTEWRIEYKTREMNDAKRGDKNKEMEENVLSGY